ncbi:MAG TPA: Uma2 family endonuclease [Gemmataceae bacterium]|nr:Uma2 family endonuclease [Gemmataceae bacterium]
MGATTNGRALTFEDFYLLIKDGEKGDLIDGVIYMSSPENTDANSLFMWLGGLIHLFVEERELGEVFGSRVAFRMDEPQGPEPDIAFVRTERLHLVKRGYVEGPPDLAIEIVSPDSVDRDYVQKREQYRQAGVQEYWIVDEMEQRVVLLRLNAAGAYREVKPRKGALHSQVLYGFWLRPEWLWQEPRPKKATVLAEILKT